jgi:pimeloyl-ACP methyl ester carboxylesterase
MVRLYVIGHSYGGFTGIQLADYLADDLAGLFTIDPISMLNCQAKEMALKVYNTLALKHPGCKSAPEDTFSIASVQHLLERNKEFPKAFWWYHTYQKEFPWLHSDSIKNGSGESPGEQQIFLKEFKSPILFGDYHSQLARLDLVWDLISLKFIQ